MAHLANATNQKLFQGSLCTFAHDVPYVTGSFLDWHYVSTCSPHTLNLLAVYFDDTFHTDSCCLFYCAALHRFLGTGPSVCREGSHGRRASSECRKERKRVAANRREQRKERKRAAQKGVNRLSSMEPGCVFIELAHCCLTLPRLATCLSVAYEMLTYVY